MHVASRIGPQRVYRACPLLPHLQSVQKPKPVHKQLASTRLEPPSACVCDTHKRRVSVSEQANSNTHTEPTFDATIQISQMNSSAYHSIVYLSKQDCVEILRSLRISATVYDNLSSVSTGTPATCHNVENGVTIALYGICKSKICHEVWPMLKVRYGLTCAHISETNFRGCILDWMRPSICPGKS